MWERALDHDPNLLGYVKDRYKIKKGLSKDIKVAQLKENYKPYCGEFFQIFCQKIA